MANCRVYTGNNNGVNVRSSKVVSSNTLLGVIDNNEYVNIVRCDDVWATLMYNGAPAFLQHEFVLNPPTINGDGLNSSDNKYAVCNGNDVNIRDGAGGNTTGLTLDKGDTVTVYEKVRNGDYYWYRIGSGQWVRGDFLAPSTNQSSGGGESSGGGTQIGYGTVTGGALYCRKMPIDGYEEWGRFPNGEVIPIYTCSTTGWYETRWPVNGSNVGYVKSQFITMNSSGENTGSAPTSGFARIKSSVTGTVNVRGSASTSGQRKGEWKANSMFYITGSSGDWRKIRFGKPHSPQAIGGDAWIKGDYIEAASAGDNFAERYCNIAKSFAGQDGAVAFEYTSSYGQWCQAFLLNMAIMAGLTNPSAKLPCETANGTNTNTWSAYQWMLANGTVSTQLSSCTIRRGDWIYYKRGDDNMSHVGLIYDVDGRKVQRVEGNIDNGSIKIVKFFPEWIPLDEIPNAYAIARNW